MCLNFDIDRVLGQVDELGLGSVTQRSLLLSDLGPKGWSGIESEPYKLDTLDKMD